MFGSWVDVISNRNPRLPKTRSCNTSSATLKGHRESRIQPNSKLNASNNKRIHFGEKNLGVGRNLSVYLSIKGSIFGATSLKK